MSLALVTSRALVGLDAPLVRVEVHLANGLPAFNLVGMPETAVKESRDRVRSALITAGFEFPARRITVNLSPADLPKEGGRYDLPIALGILVASQQLPQTCLDKREFIGELALNGELREVAGVLPTALAAAAAGNFLVVPAANINEAGLVPNLQAGGAQHLLEVAAALTQHSNFIAPQPTINSNTTNYPDLLEVKGQQAAKRALTLAAAGQHNLLFSGPPGSGKTLLARCLPGLLPEASAQEALEIAAIQSIIQGFDAASWRQRPFRSPHHTSSAAALVGGGSNPQPGEISLAHKGILFLDELPEFSRHVLEVLREPLEAGVIHLARAQRKASYPAEFLLIAAMNPCPCGYLGDPRKACNCAPSIINRYQARISGPLLDRIDLHLEVPALPPNELWQPAAGASSAQIRTQVSAARDRQLHRAGKPNAKLNPAELERFAPLATEQQNLLTKAMERMQLSARAAHRVIKVALTLADLDEQPKISSQHLLEALSFRKLPWST